MYDNIRIFLYYLVSTQNSILLKYKRTSPILFGLASILSNIKIPYNGIILEKNLLIFSTEMYVEHSCIIKKTLPFKKRLLTLCMTVLFCLIYPSDLNLTLVMDPTLVQRKINVLFP